MSKAKVIGEAVVYNGYNKIIEAIVEDNGKQISREKLSRPDAVFALIYNVETECVVFTKQHRYPTVRENYDGYIIEAIAGKIDLGETPLEALKRETLEEVGYKLKDKNIIECCPVYTSPGYSGEIIYPYLATVTNKDKVSKGGGKDDETENIEVVEMPYLIFKNNLDYFNDLKTRMLGYEAHHKKLFDIKPPIKSNPVNKKINTKDNYKLNL